MNWIQDPTIRGLVTAVLSAVLTALTTWATTNSVKTIVVAGGTTLCSVLLSAWGLNRIGSYYRDRARAA